MKIQIELKNQMVCLTLDEAKEVYSQLKELFDREVEQVPIPTYPIYPSHPNPPWYPSYPWDTTYKYAIPIIQSGTSKFSISPNS